MKQLVYRYSSAWTLLGAAALALTLAACASSSREVAPQASSALTPVRTEALAIKDQVAKTANAARGLINNPSGDLTGPVNALNAQLNDLKGNISHGRAAVSSADTRADDYFTSWDAQLKTMSADMAKTGEQRRAEAMHSYDQLGQSIQSVRSEMAPFMQDLSEAQRYLTYDKTTAGVKAAEPQIKSALGRENAILANLDKVIKDIDAIQGRK